jgi:hypothetical protein
VSVRSPLVGSRESQQAGDKDRWELGRLVLTIGCAPALAGYALAVMVLGLIVGSAPGAEITALGTVRAAGLVWLAAHRVPLMVEGAPLGALPLLPTLLLGALVAMSSSRIARRRGYDQPRDAARIVGIAAVMHALLGIGVAMAVSTPAGGAAPVQAAFGCGFVAGVAAACGLLRPCRLLPAALQGAPGWTSHAVAAAALGSAVLFTGGLATVLAGLLASTTAVHDLFAAGGQAAGGQTAGRGLGLTLLSVAYLPNAAVAAASWSVGTGVSIGAVSVTPLGVLDGPVPAVPLLAALPEGPAASWWVIAFALPLVTGAVTGYRCSFAGEEPAVRVRASAAAAGMLAVAGFVLAALAGGRLGEGAFDPVQVPAGSFAVAVLVWTFLPAALVAWWWGRRGDSDAPAAG